MAKPSDFAQAFAHGMPGPEDRQDIFDGREHSPKTQILRRPVDRKAQGVGSCRSEFRYPSGEEPFSILGLFEQNFPVLADVKRYGRR